MKSNRTMKVKINKKHPRQSLKICRGYLFVFCGSIFIIRRSVCSVISLIRTSALSVSVFLQYFFKLLHKSTCVSLKMNALYSDSFGACKIFLAVIYKDCFLG